MPMECPVICCHHDQQSVHQIRTQTVKIIHFLKDYHLLLNAYLSDYFAREHWKVVPTNWWQILSQVDPPQLAFLLKPGAFCSRQVWPLSLLAFRAAASSLALSRQPLILEESVVKKLKPTVTNSCRKCLEKTQKRKNEVTSLSKNDSSHISGTKVTKHWRKADVSDSMNGKLCESAEALVVEEKRLNHSITDDSAEAQNQNQICQDTCNDKVCSVSSCYSCDRNENVPNHICADSVKFTKNSRKAACQTNVESAKVMSASENLKDAECGNMEEVAYPATGLQTTETSNGRQTNQASKTTIKDGQCMFLEHCYRRHVKPKKQHEILQLGQTLQKLSEAGQCSHVIDIGAGQGHLSRLLSFGYGMSVTTIEAVDCHAPKATKFDREVQDDIKKGKLARRKSKHKTVKSGFSGEETIPQAVSNATEPTHVIARIDANITIQEFLQRISQTQDMSHKMPPPSESSEEKNGSVSASRHNTCETFVDKSSGEEEHRNINVLGKTDLQIENYANGHKSTCKNSDKTSKLDDAEADGTVIYNDEDCMKANNFPTFILTGLHACGDLSATMIRVFARCPLTVGLGSVACCYMKLSTDGDNQKEAGYPMSQFVQSLPNHPLSWEAREMACHFIEAYLPRLIGNEPNLKSHCYRSALQEVLYQRDPTLTHGTVKVTVKNTHQQTFERYAALALQKLGQDGSLSEEELRRGEQRLLQWSEVVAFYTLRLSLAPVVESLLLLDRVLFLAEQGVSSCLLPIFDPELSPRNFVLLALK